MKVLNIVCFIILLVSCHSQMGESGIEVADQSVVTTSAETMKQGRPAKSAQEVKKIIRSVETKYRVEDLIASTSYIEDVADKFDGVIENMNQVNSNHVHTNVLTLRLPSEHMTACLTKLQKESAHTDYTRIKSRDVTEEYLDITTRLATKKDVRDLYVQILRNKAKTIQEVLTAEDKIRVLQEEIESIEGRLKYLSNQTDRCTIRIEIYQEVEYVAVAAVNKKTFLTDVKIGFKHGFNLVQIVIIGLVTIWPILLLFGFFMAFRKWRMLHHA